MNHNVYHIEKQTFHFGGYWLLTGTLFFLYLPTSQFEMQNAYHALSKRLNPDPATFLPVWFIFGIFGLCFYLCYELFLIAENGVISSRVTRYLTLPLRRQDYYKIKARIFFEKFGVLLLTLVAMFHISFLGYRLPLSLWKRSLPELILTCCFLFFAAILIFAGYLFHDLYCLKHHH